MPGVKDLLARFEQKGENSPPENDGRGRSPGLSIGSTGTCMPSVILDKHGSQSQLPHTIWIAAVLNFRDAFPFTSPIEREQPFHGPRPAWRTRLTL
jgi:hypothetical protein